MKLLQLQRIVDGKNVGGLYINVDKVAAVFPSTNNNGTGYRDACIQVEGVVYTTAFTVSEVLDMLVENR